MDNINQLLNRLELEHLRKNGASVETKAEKPEREEKPQPLKVYVASKLPPDHSYFKSVASSDAPWKKKNRPDEASQAVVIKPPSDLKAQTDRSVYSRHERWRQYDRKPANSDKDKSKKVDDKHSLAKEFLLALQKDHESDAKNPINDEDRVVEGLNVTLLDHQVSGLRFFRKRESNPDAHRGGMLCDDMGLGKTIQMISLILANRPKAAFRKKSKSFPVTLVVCPLAVASQWCKEIQTKAPSLRVYLFHGSDKITEHEELLRFDVVVTTYNVVLWDSKKKSESILSAGNWWRIILDEAHTIKNYNSMTAQSCIKLKSDQKWCLTGTPIQNNLEEIRAYLLFLKMGKYADVVKWNLDIAKTIQKGNPDEALDLLKQDFAPFFLRRSKAILQQSASGFTLPPKIIHSELIEFDSKEKILYSMMERRMKGLLDFEEDDELEGQVTLKVNVSSIKGYLGALVCLLRLRQICCHWNLLYEFKEEELENAYTANSSENSDNKLEDSVEDLNHMMKDLEVTEKKCLICRSQLMSHDVVYCSECKSLSEQQTPPIERSAKSERLLEILKRDPARKTIVFSQFTKLLATLKPFLTKNGFKCVMYEGTMSRAMRDSTLKEFNENPETTVLLCSLKCGAIGLNLTIANRVVLYDPWWNPQVEDQAIDRVYRFGQTKEVDVYRLIIKDSVEENIVRLQEKKRQVAEAVVDIHGKKKVSLNSGLTRKELYQLFGLKFGLPY
ncbi:BA75_04717T0 [Komagataella pastoris]|uniref:BA75_04717T0 n=1 Tax=Komagataella pastoris TaxID=4922 RepID=A0A1B2JHM4_PICPA|nr:BA75_04717T0 [Komagataella pastoris]